MAFKFLQAALLAEEAPPRRLSTDLRELLHETAGRAVTLGELAQALVMDRSALGHNLRPLEREHLVALGIAEGDRRARAITLTAAGRQRLGEARKLWRTAQRRFHQEFGVEQARTLRALLANAATADYGDSP